MTRSAPATRCVRGGADGAIAPRETVTRADNSNLWRIARTDGRTPTHRPWSWGRPFAALLALAILLLTGGVIGLLVLDRAADVADEVLFGPTASNDDLGNPHIEDVLIDRLPSGTLRSYMNTGPDCDDRRTGSVAAAWTKGVRPAAIVDQLTEAGWSRTNPADVPEWYTANIPAGEPSSPCLSPHAGAWQALGRPEYPTPECSAPAETQIVVAKSEDARFFVVRLNAAGLTVDVAHTKDGRAAERILRQQGQEPV